MLTYDDEQLWISFAGPWQIWERFHGDIPSNGHIENAVRKVKGVSRSLAARARLHSETLINPLGWSLTKRILSHVHCLVQTETDRQTDRQAGRQADTQTHRHTQTQTNRQTDRDRLDAKRLACQSNQLTDASQNSLAVAELLRR